LPPTKTVPSGDGSKARPRTSSAATSVNPWVPRTHYDALLLRCAEAEADLRALIERVTLDPEFITVTHANDHHAAAQALLEIL
jgi:hypothetical protein